MKTRQEIMDMAVRIVRPAAIATVKGVPLTSNQIHAIQLNIEAVLQNAINYSDIDFDKWLRQRSAASRPVRTGLHKKKIRVREVAPYAGQV